jgi:hypothetical protein
LGDDRVEAGVGGEVESTWTAQCCQYDGLQHYTEQDGGEQVALPVSHNPFRLGFGDDRLDHVQRVDGAQGQFREPAIRVQDDEDEGVGLGAVGVQDQGDQGTQLPLGRFGERCQPL